MDRFNLYVQRLGIAAAAFLAGFALNTVSAGFGPNLQIHSFWALLISLFGWFVGYRLLYIPMLGLVARNSLIKRYPIPSVMTFNVVFATALFVSVYLAIGALLPTLVTVLSLPGLIFSLLSLFVTLNGLLFALSYRPRS